MKKRLHYLILVLIALVLVVAVPIIINELYKSDCGYKTMWGAAEALNYYGMILAALVGIVGVFLTVYAANKNYREDERNRILPLIAVNTIDQKGLDPFDAGFDEDNSEKKTADELLEQLGAQFYFLIGKKIAALRELPQKDLEAIAESSVVWKRGTRDGRMYVRDSEIVCLPLEIENVGNGIARRLSIGLSMDGKEPHFESETSLKRDEKRKIIIYSRNVFETIKGNYTLKVVYCDVAGNKYEQTFPLEFSTDNDKRLKSINLSGDQHFFGRD